MIRFSAAYGKTSPALGSGVWAGSPPGESIPEARGTGSRSLACQEWVAMQLM